MQGALILGLDGHQSSIRGVDIESVGIASRTSAYELGLMMADVDGVLTARFDYRVRSLEPRLVAVLADEFVKTCNAVASQNVSQIGGLRWHSKTESERWSAASRGLVAARESNDTIYAKFANIVLTHAQEIAVETRYEKWPYRKLCERAGEFAAAYLSRSVGVGDRVAVIVNREADVVAAMLGAWQIGAVYVPVDASYPAARINDILADCSPRIIVCADQLKELVPLAFEPNLLTISSLVTSRHSDLSLPAIDGRHAAYIIYTSGSTGKPKGVLVSHSGVINFAMAQAAQLGIRETDRLAQLASFGFDASMSDVLMSFFAGARIVIADEVQRMPGLEFDAFLRDRGITVITTAASLLEAARSVAYPDLRIVISTAEACKAETVAKWGIAQRLYNGYGPTEASVGATLGLCKPALDSTAQSAPAIGHPFENCSIYILDSALRPLPFGVEGEIYIGGAGIAMGYWGDSRKTAQLFLPDPFSDLPGTTMYRTGDFGTAHEGGDFEFVSRRDHQINVRGFRVELAEIERIGAGVSGVRHCAAVVPDGNQPRSSIAFFYDQDDKQTLTAQRVKDALSENLPNYMQPATVSELAQYLCPENGKIDRNALRKIDVSSNRHVERDLDSGLCASVANIWHVVLGHDSFDTTDNFFDVGGQSLLLSQVQARIADELAVDVPLVKLFELPTINSLVYHIESLRGSLVKLKPATAPKKKKTTQDKRVAIVGIAGRWPDAPEYRAFWSNILDQKCSIRLFSEQELQMAGVADSVDGFVPARAPLDDVAMFDAEFFHYTPREAQFLDPQKRVLLEAAYHALEDAGYASVEQRSATSIGVFMASSGSSYFENVVRPQEKLLEVVGKTRAALACDKSFTATTISYKLGLTGPAITVDTACSSSLVGVHQAVRAIQSGDCEMALAGGASVDVPVVGGHVFEQGGIASSDGMCRVFDADATGTVKGMGAGVILMKSYASAVADGDNIYATILGSAINNDGHEKMGFTAPSVGGQEAVLRSALADAGVTADSVQFVEAHGTGTPVGDPIEMEAIHRVFGGRENSPLLVGSVKSNIGHLDAAAGIAGLIKTALSLKHRELPPTINFHIPNKRLNLTKSGIKIAQSVVAWHESRGPVVGRS